MNELVVTLDITDRLGRITLNRPDDGNRFTPQMMQLFCEKLSEAQASEVDVLAITAEGEDFCLGRAAGSEDQTHSNDEVLTLIQQVNAQLAAFEGISVAGVRGRALGFGGGVVLQTDISVASTDSRFGFPEIKRGLPPLFILSHLSSLLNRKAALELVLSGRTLTAQEALEIGLISRAVPEEFFGPTLEHLLTELLEKSPELLRMCKKFMVTLQDVPRGSRSEAALTTLRGLG